MIVLLCEQMLIRGKYLSTNIVMSSMSLPSRQFVMTHTSIHFTELVIACSIATEQGHREDWESLGQIENMGSHKMDCVMGVWGHASTRFYML